MNAFTSNSVMDYLIENNPSQNEFEICKKNFTNSCAGYIIASFVLGLGDRHNDNIMVKNKNFNLFLSLNFFFKDSKKWKSKFFF